MWKKLFRFFSFRNAKCDPGYKFRNLNRIPGYGDEGSGDFQCVEVLGKGGFSMVVKVFDPQMLKFYALKVISMVRVSRERFINEVQIHYSLQGHENIMPMLAAFEDSKDFYILMEIAHLGSMLTFIEAAGITPEGPLLKRIMKQMLAAMDHCHRNNVLHRDIKPDNFLFCEDGKLKLTDFGLAKKFESSDQKHVGAAGTKPFRAPEVRGNEPYGLKADMYSVGVVLHMLLRGHYMLDCFENAALVSLIIKSMWPISENLHDLLRSLLSVEMERPSAQEASAHPWFLHNRN